jgi:hypothetical protein
MSHAYTHAHNLATLARADRASRSILRLNLVESMTLNHRVPGSSPGAPIADHNKRFPTKYAKFGNSPLVSLDEVLFEDGTTTRGDTVSRGLWLWD